MKRKSIQSNASESAQAILAMIQQIPKGKVATYGQVAALAGFPRNARQVGTILRKLPPNSGVPWYRVINSKGEISLRGTEDHVFRQRDFLEAEGIEFVEMVARKKVTKNDFRSESSAYLNGDSDVKVVLKVSLAKYRWTLRNQE